MCGTLVGTWTSLIPGCLISRVLQCNADESQFPSQPRVQLVAPGASRQVLSLKQGRRCQLSVAQSCDDLLGLRLRMQNHPGIRFFMRTWSQIRSVVTSKSQTKDLLAFSCDDLFLLLQ